MDNLYHKNDTRGQFNHRPLNRRLSVKAALEQRQRTLGSSLKQKHNKRERNVAACAKVMDAYMYVYMLIGFSSLDRTARYTFI